MRISKKLIDQIGQKRAIAFIGAGITNATVSEENRLIVGSWVGLIKNAVAFCLFKKCVTDAWFNLKKEKLSAAEITTDELLDIGDEVMNILTANAIEGEWYSMFQELRAVKPELLTEIKEWGLPIATTNYDNLIEQVLKLNPITINDSQKVETFLNPFEKNKYVLHIHGFYLQPDTIVFGRKSYHNITQNPFAQFVNQYLVTYYKTVIFLGFGLGVYDANFQLMFKWVADHLKATVLYHLVLTRDVKSVRLKHLEMGNKSVKVIGFGRKHADLLAFCKQITGKLSTSGPLSISSHREPLIIGIDRLKKISELSKRLVQGSKLPIAILGTNGIGKTNLLLNLLYHELIIRKYGLHRILVRCEQADSYYAFLIGIVNAFNFKLKADTINLEEELLKRIAVFDYPILIAFDNFETPWYISPVECKIFLERLQILVEVILTMRGEHAPVAVKCHELKLHPLEPEAAQLLFHHFSNNKFKDEESVVTLAAQLDFLPLPIILIAKRALSSPSLQILTEEYDKKKLMLLRIPGFDSDKNMNLLLSIELSYLNPLLTADDRDVLRTISLLPQGITWEHFLLIFDNGFEMLARFKATGIIEEDINGRLFFFSTVRSYLLDLPIKDSTLKTKMFEFFLAFAEDNGSLIGKTAQATVNIQSNWNNLIYILENSEISDTKANAIFALTLFARLNGYEFERVLNNMHDNTADNDIKAKCQLSLGQLAFVRTNNEKARSLFAEALKYFTDNNDYKRQAECKKWLGDLLWRTSKSAEAKKTYQQVLKIYKNNPQKLGMALTMKGLGDIELQRANLRSAQKWYEKALLLFKDENYLLGEAQGIKGLADIEIIENNKISAAEKYQIAQKKFKEIGSVLGYANCVRRLGTIALKNNDYSEAIRQFQTAIPLFEQVGDLLGKANSLANLGDIAVLQAQYEKARSYYSKSLPMYHEVGDSMGEAFCNYGFGNIEKGLGNYDQANAFYMSAIPLVKKIKDKFSLGQMHEALGDLFKLRGDLSESEKEYCRAKKLYISAGCLQLTIEKGWQSLPC